MTPAATADGTVFETARHERIVLLVILALAALIRVVYFVGAGTADDISIATNAIRIVEDGFFLPTGQYALRIGLIYPLAAVFALFGTGEIQLAVLPLLASLAGVWLAYRIGCLLVNGWAGLAAAALLAVFPLDIVTATRFLPDTPLGTVLGLAVYLALRSRSAANPDRWLIAAGTAWAYAYFIRIDAFALGPAMLAIALYEKARLRTLVLLCAPFALAVFGEALVYFLLSADWLHRVHGLGSIDMQMREEFSGRSLLDFPKAWFVTFYEFGLHYYLLAAALVYAAIRRDRASVIVAAWVLGLLIWLEFGGNPLHWPYHVKSHLTRYCMAVGIPMAVLSAMFLHHLWHGGHRRVVIAAGVLTGFAAIFMINFNTLNGERETATKLALDYALKHDAFPLYMDRGSNDLAGFLLYGTPYAAKIHPIQQHNFATGKTELVDLRGKEGYLLLNRGFQEFRQNRYFMEAMSAPGDAADAKPVFATDNPMPALAYLQVRILMEAASLIPVKALSNKIRATGEELLEGREAVIYRLRGPAQ